MDNKLWNEAWKTNQIGFHQTEVNANLIKYFHHFTNKNDPFFIPLCGKSKDMDWINSQGHAIIGVEIIEKAITDFLKERNLSPEITYLEKNARCYQTKEFKLYHQDIFDFKSSPLLNIYDRGSLIALPSEIRAKYAQKIIELTTSGSEILLITLSYDQNIASGPPFSVPPSLVEELYANHFTIKNLQNSTVDSLNSRFVAAGLTKMNHHVFFLKRI